MRKFLWLLMFFWLLFVGEGWAQWVDPNTNSSWGVYPVQANADGTIATPANFFSANLGAILNTISNRGVYVSSWGVEHMPSCCWSAYPPLPHEQYWQGSNDWRFVGFYPALLTSGVSAVFMGPTTGGDTNRYIELSNAVVAASFSVDSVEAYVYESGEPLTPITNVLAWVSDANAIRFYRSDTNPVTIAVAGLSLRYGESSPFYGTTNDFAGILVRVDDPVDEMSPVNLRTFDAELDDILADVAAAKTVYDNGWSLSAASNGYTVTRHDAPMFAIDTNGNVSISAGLTIGGTNSTALFAPGAITNTLAAQSAQIAALVNLGVGFTNSPNLMLADGSRTLTHLGVAPVGTNIFRLITKAGAVVVGSADLATLNHVTNAWIGLNSITNWVRPEGFYLNTSGGKNSFLLNPGLAGTLTLIPWAITNSSTGGATEMVWPASNSVYAVSLTLTNAMSGDVELTVSMGGTTNISYPRVPGDVTALFYVRTDEPPVISAVVTSNQLAITRIAVEAFAPWGDDGDVVAVGSVSAAGAMRASRFEENGVALSESYLSRAEAPTAYVHQASFGAYSNAMTVTVAAVRGEIAAASNALAGSVSALSDSINATLSAAQLGDLLRGLGKVSPYGLVAYYAFEDGLVDIVSDLWTNEFVLARTGVEWAWTNDALNVRNGFVAITAHGQCLLGSTNAMLRPPTGTIAAWINVGQHIEYDAPLIAGPCGWYNLMQSGTNIHFFTTYPGYTCPTPAGWNHVALTWTTNSMQSWLNGSLMDSRAASFSPVSTNAFVIGGRVQSARANLDDVMLFNRVLSSNELNTLRVNQKYGGSGLHQ